MDDKLVSAVLESLRDNAYANGLSLERLHPIIDDLINRLRNAGLDDDFIRQALVGTDD